MRKLFIISFLFFLLSSAFGQFNSHDGYVATPADLTAGTFTYSTQHNPQLSNPTLTNQFEFVFASAPASTTISITPYMRGGTVAGSAITSSVTGSQVVSVSGLADYYVVVVAWSGSPGQVSVNITGVLASLIRKTGTYTSIRSGTSSNTDLHGRVILSNGTATQPLTGTYSSTPDCLSSDDTALASSRCVASGSGSSWVLTITGTGSDVIKYATFGGN